MTAWPHCIGDCPPRAGACDRTHLHGYTLSSLGAQRAQGSIGVRCPMCWHWGFWLHTGFRWRCCPI